MYWKIVLSEFFCYPSYFSYPCICISSRRYVPHTDHFFSLLMIHLHFWDILFSYFAVCTLITSVIFHLLLHPFSRVFGFAFVLVLRWYAWAIYTKNWEEFWETVLLTPLGMCLKQWRMQRYWNSMFKKWLER